MNKVYLLFIAILTVGTVCHAALLPDVKVEVQGIDVRDKDDKYLLSIGKENILLEERSYKLMKVVGEKKQLVAQGQAVFSGSDLEHDTEAIWVNENTEIKIGKMTGVRAPKQVIVLKLKDRNRTFAFELFQE